MAETVLSDRATADAGSRSATRQRIIDVAARLFCEQGYRTTSLQEIAEHVGIRKASLYYHMPSKQHLLSQILSGCIEPACRRLAAIQASEQCATDKLRSAVEMHVLDLTSNFQAVRIFLREGHALPTEEVAEFMEYRRTYSRLFRLILEEGQAAGEFADIDVHHAQLALLGMLNWIAFWYRPDGSSTPWEVARSFGELAVGAVTRGAAGNVEPAASRIDLSAARS